MKLFEYRLKRGKKKEGITAMSIVDDPAILIDFIKLSKDEDNRKVLPAELHNDVVDYLKEKGETKQSLIDEGYVLIATNNILNEDGKKHLHLAIESDPDATSYLDSGDYKFRFRYDGPRDSKNRDFCAKVLDMDLIYRKEDINQMSFRSENSKFGTYSIFAYKGSYNCRHKWVLETYLKVNDERIQNIPSVTPDIDSSGLKVNSKVGLSKDTVLLSINKDKQIITGPALIPNLKIFRSADSLGLEEDGYIYFSENTVREMSQLFLMTEKMNTVTLGHEVENTDLKLIESWIIEDPKLDKSVSLGFNLPKGTWMVSYKVEDKDLWSRIKTGEFNGFSIEATGFEMFEKELDLANQEIIDEEEAAKILIDLCNSYLNKK